MISHRLKTVHNADHIVVFHQGKVVEQGTHDELLLKKGVYFSLVEKQTMRAAMPVKVERKPLPKPVTWSPAAAEAAADATADSK
jgi:ABC-type multidrug transport system ATPase subunit